MLAEAYAYINYTMMYYSGETRRAHMPFNFNFITYLNKTPSAADIRDSIYLWLDNMPRGQWPNWVVSTYLYLNSTDVVKNTNTFRWAITTTNELLRDSVKTWSIR